MDRTAWNDEFKETPDHVDVPDHLLDSELCSLEPGTALDLGCGSGRNALKLVGLGWTVVGVDWAERAVELARQASREKSPPATFIVGDITEWKPSSQFDLVISTFALPGGEDSRRVLVTAADATAPGGTLIVCEWDRSMAEVWPFDADDLLTPEEIAATLLELEIEKAEVRPIEVFTEDDPRAFAGTSANVVFVRARRPA